MDEDTPPIDEHNAAKDAAANERLRHDEDLIRELEQQGWVWRGTGVGKVLSLPDDPDVYNCFDPYTGEHLLSPKLRERLREQLRKDQTAGELRVPDR